MTVVIFSASLKNNEVGRTLTSAQKSETSNKVKGLVRLSTLVVKVRFQSVSIFGKIWKIEKIYSPSRKTRLCDCIIQCIIRQSPHIYAEVAFFKYAALSPRKLLISTQNMHDYIIPAFSLKKCHIYLSRKLKNVLFTSHKSSHFSLLPWERYEVT